VVTSQARRHLATLLRYVLPLGVLGLILLLALHAFRTERSHRTAAEQVLRDDARMAATEFIRRTAFDLAFNGYQALTTALLRSDADGHLALPAGAPRALPLVRRLAVLEGNTFRVLSGDVAPPWLEPWVRAEAAALPREREEFVVRHRVIDGQAATLVLVSLEQDGHRLAAIDVDLEAQRPFLQLSLDRGPLLPAVIGDHLLTNEMMSVAHVDHAGKVRLKAGPAPRPEWEETVAYGEWIDGILRGSTVRVSLSPAVAGKLIPGGVPASQLPLLGVLVAGAVALLVLVVRADRKQRALTRAREDFVVAVSHELRTPLAQIRLFTETVLFGRSRSATEQTRFLEAAVRESIRLGHLVDNVLDFSRVERGASDLHPEVRPLAPLVAQAVEAFAPLASSRRVRFELQLDAAAIAPVDEAGLRRILVNLLDNAVKYGPREGVVTVRLAQRDGRVELAVEDEGPGIPEDERDSVFVPFRRLERDRRSGTTGTGLGLTLVHELAKGHGGGCRIETCEAGGARLVVTLPAGGGR
jgi:signal transduction histidine kinase